ncbi:uncharacterized protein LOC101858652 [Aplysia californica]|uniref:Uncharacterized protein LOC101858652 n=1 Tax=Aplysia californica TaxID=6500 RepID=A0ABM0JXN1_APLCA|nr:uncharacterized protein LOC101858652 [Aplysia californica]
MSCGDGATVRNLTEGTTKCPGKSGFMNDDVTYTVRFYLDFVVQMSIVIFGISSNIVNIVIFVKTGLEDSVTISFLALAISDLGFSVFFLLMRIFGILSNVYKLGPTVSMGTISYLLFWYMNLFFDISVLVTTFTAVEKCCCVAIPLLFKNVFTRFRTVITLVVIYLAVLVTYIPTFSSHGLKLKFDPVRNHSRYVYANRSYTMLVFDIYTVFNRMVIPFVSQVAVLFCMVVLTIKLQVATKKRREMTSEQSCEVNESNDRKNKEKVLGKGKNRLSRKEWRVVQAVNLVAGIFVASNLPEIVISFCALYYPEFSDFGRYKNLYRVVTSLQDLITVTSAAVNIFVYLGYNSKYRQEFLRSIGPTEIDKT